MQPPDEWRARDRTSRLLLDVAAGRPTSVQDVLSRTDLELAVRHGLIGLLAQSKNEEFRKVANPVFARLLARQEVMQTHLRRLLIHLRDADIRATVVKGPYLALWAYADHTARTFTDIDLLVQPEDLEQTMDVLARYEAVSRIPPQTPDADKRHIPFLDSTGVRFTLDLHWDLFSYHQLQGCADGAVEWAWNQARFDPDHSLGPMWDLPPEITMAFLATHALLDHRFRLILFRDIAEATRRGGLDWNAIVDFAARWALRTPIYLSLLISARTMDAPIDDQVLDQLRPRYQMLRWVEKTLPKIDLVRFDGHRPHPLNLGVVLLHDRLTPRARLLMRAPLAFPRWQRTVEPEWSRARTAGRRITVLVSTNQRRGAEVNGERLACGLEDRGWNVSLLALSDSGSDPVIGARTLGRENQGRRLDLGVIAKLRRFIRTTRPDIVLANGGATLRYAVAATFMQRRRPLVVYESIGQPSYWLRNRWQTLMQAILHRRADLILAVSELTKAELVDILGYDRDLIDVVYVGVPDSFLTDHPPRDDGRLHLLYLGALSREKNPIAALDVAAKLPNADLRFVGSGDEQTRLMGAIDRLHLNQRAQVIGSVANVTPHLAWADVLLVTSRTEGFPGAVIEAAAAGVPTVGFDVGGMREAVVDGQTGLLVAADDIDGVVDALRALDTDRDRLRDLALGAQTRVAEQFLTKHAIRRHAAAFTRILAGPRP